MTDTERQRTVPRVGDPEETLVDQASRWSFGPAPRPSAEGARPDGPVGPGRLAAALRSSRLGRALRGLRG